MNTTIDSDKAVEAVLEKKRKEIEQIISEEKKHIKDQLEDNLKKNLLSKGKDKFLELEALMKKEEDFLEKKLNDLINHNEYFGRSIEVDKRVAKKLKKDIMTEIVAIEKRIISGEKALIEEIRTDLIEEVKTFLGNMETEIKKTLSNLLSGLPISSNQENQENIAHAVLENRCDVSLENKEAAKAYELKTGDKSPIASEVRCALVKSCSEEKREPSMMDSNKSLKELYSNSNRKVPFWGSKSTNLVGSYNLRILEEREDTDRNKDLYKNFISSNAFTKSSRTKFGKFD